MQKNKIVTFIGFAVRARKIKCGVNAIKTIRSSAPVLVICKTASQNTFFEAVSLAKKLSAKLIVSNTYLIEEVVNKPNCKLIAITDKGLADAVLNHLDSCFTEYSGGYDK